MLVKWGSAGRKRSKVGSAVTAILVLTIILVILLLTGPIIKRVRTSNIPEETISSPF